MDPTLAPRDRWNSAYLYEMGQKDEDERALQSVVIKGAMAEDFSPAAGKLFKVPGENRATWGVQDTTTGEIATGVLVPDEKHESIEDAIAELVSRLGFEPIWLFQDDWPKNKDKFLAQIATLEGTGQDLGHWLNRIIASWNPHSSLFGPACKALSAIVLLWDQVKVGDIRAKLTRPGGYPKGSKIQISKDAHGSAVMKTWGEMDCISDAQLRVMIESGAFYDTFAVNIEKHLHSVAAIRDGIRRQYGSNVGKEDAKGRMLHTATTLRAYQNADRSCEGLLEHPNLPRYITVGTDSRGEDKLKCTAGTNGMEDGEAMM